LVFGALADKAWPAMLDRLAPLTTHRVYVAPQGRAAAPPSELAARHPGWTAESVSEALARARGLAGTDGLVVVCGSLYLVGEARAILLGLESDPPVAM
jgi:dihydrofolate synthase/folylpolyglutamate synthase